MCLFAYHRKMDGTNLMKLCTKLADIPRGNIGLFPFRFLHHFKMVAFCMWYDSLP